MTPAPPLAGIRVLDLTSVVFGPYAAQSLADAGADVLKIEPPAGDSTRLTGPAREAGMAAIFLGVNRSKRSVVLDLKQPSARAALLALVDQADVFMHSVRPQKMAALGLDPDTLRRRNPRLVYAGLHGFGETGPYAGQPAYDDIVQGMSGLADLMARQTGEPRYLPTIAADKTCGLVAAQAILAALFARERTGEGQFVEIPMFESMVSFTLLEHFYGRHVGEPGPNATGYPRVLAPWRRPYRTADGHLCLMPYTDAHWQRFFAHAYPAAVGDARFASMSARTTHIAALYALLGEIVATQSTAHWLELCQRLEIPAAPLGRLDALEDDPHLKAVDFFVDVPDAAVGSYRLTRSPVRYAGVSATPGRPPRLGEHTRAALAEAGLSEADIAALIAEGAAVQAPVPDITGA